jgi:hypothetical protein
VASYYFPFVAKVLTDSVGEGQLVGLENTIIVDVLVGPGRSGSAHCHHHRHQRYPNDQPDAPHEHYLLVPTNPHTRIATAIIGT